MVIVSVAESLLLLLSIKCSLQSFFIMAPSTSPWIINHLFIFYILPETLDGNPIVSRRNKAIPNHVLLEINELIIGGRLEDAVTYIRGKLLPPGYVRHPFRKTQTNLSWTSLGPLLPLTSSEATLKNYSKKEKIFPNICMFRRWTL